MAPIAETRSRPASYVAGGIGAQLDQQSRRIERLQETIDFLAAETLFPRFGTSRKRRWLGMTLGALWQHASKPMRLPPPPPPLPTPAPTISIVTPSYQQAEFLERTLRSVLDQHYPALEYVVQDGGSRDGSQAILERYAPRLARWESRPDRGQAHAVQLGFADATGEIMAYLNSDDLLLPGSLAAAAAYFARHPDVDVVYGHRVIVDAYDGEVGRWVLPPHDSDILRYADYVPQETLFWRRRLWDKVGGVDPRFQFALDWDLLLRFQAAGAKFARMDRFLGAFRIHRRQKTFLSLVTVGETEMQELRLREHGRHPTQHEIADALRGYRRRALWYTWLYRMGRLERE